MKTKCHTSIAFKKATPTRAAVEKILPEPWRLLAGRGPKGAATEPPSKGAMVCVPANEERGCEELRKILYGALADADMEADLEPIDSMKEESALKKIEAGIAARKKTPGK
jgi:hypothetical protein